jgi:hypothetical protein
VDDLGGVKILVEQRAHVDVEQLLHLDHLERAAQQAAQTLAGRELGWWDDDLILDDDVFVHLIKIGVEVAQALFFLRVEAVQLLQEAFDVRPKSDRLTFEGHARQGGVRYYFNRLFKLVHQEAKGLEAALAKAIQHGGAGVVGDAIPAERGARAARRRSQSHPIGDPLSREEVGREINLMDTAEQLLKFGLQNYSK